MHRLHMFGPSFDWFIALLRFASCHKSDGITFVYVSQSVPPSRGFPADFRFPTDLATFVVVLIFVRVPLCLNSYFILS